MPVKVVKKTGARPYKIVEKDTGKVVGSSDNKKDAEAAARVRNMVAAGKTFKRAKK